jgi:hypothetical protein
VLAQRRRPPVVQARNVRYSAGDLILFRIHISGLYPTIPHGGYGKLRICTPGGGCAGTFYPATTASSFRKKTLYDDQYITPVLYISDVPPGEPVSVDVNLYNASGKRLLYSDRLDLR